MKTVVTLGLSRLSVLSKIDKARFIVSSITTSPYFNPMPPNLAEVTANANALEVANMAAHNGGMEETSALRVKETKLEISLKTLAAYVEAVAHNSANNAETIVLSAGMAVRSKSSYRTPDFDVKPTGNEGEIKIMCKALSRATYEFQMTTDPSQESSWQRIYVGTRSRFLKAGLASATRYYFRACTISKDGLSPWSQVLNKVAL